MRGSRGQSLADVVRASKEARKGQAPKKSLGTITNETSEGGGRRRVGGEDHPPSTKSKTVPQAKVPGGRTSKGTEADAVATTYDVPA